MLVGWQDLHNSAGKWRDFSPGYKGFYARYTRLNIGVPETPALDTWNTQQVALSYVIPLHTRAINGYPRWMQFEYERNTETAFPGGIKSPTTCSLPNCGARSEPVVAKLRARFQDRLASRSC